MFSSSCVFHEWCMKRYVFKVTAQVTLEHQNQEHDLIRMSTLSFKFVALVKSKK